MQLLESEYPGSYFYGNLLLQYFVSSEKVKTVVNINVLYNFMKKHLEEIFC